MTRTRLELVERELTAPPPRKPGAGAAIWQAVLALLSEGPTPISFGRPRRVLDCLRSCEAIESNSRLAGFMTPKPIAIGLLLCDRVIVDNHTNHGKQYTGL